MTQKQNDTIIEANNDLLDAITHINTVKFIVKALEASTRGLEVDEALHCLELVAHGALRVVIDTRQKLQDAEDCQ